MLGVGDWRGCTNPDTGSRDLPLLEAPHAFSKRHVKYAYVPYCPAGNFLIAVTLLMLIPRHVCHPLFRIYASLYLFLLFHVNAQKKEKMYVCQQKKESSSNTLSNVPLLTCPFLFLLSFLFSTGLDWSNQNL